MTATRDSIAEQNRTVALASNVDDLDDMLGELALAAGHILLAEIPHNIASPSAVWAEAVEAVEVGHSLPVSWMKSANPGAIEGVRHGRVKFDPQFNYELPEEGGTVASMQSIRGTVIRFSKRFRLVLTPPFIK